MRKSTIISSNANVYRFGGCGVDQLVASTSQRATEHFERNLGIANWANDAGLMPRGMSNFQFGIPGNKQPVAF